MVSSLSDEPRKVPTGLAPRFANHALHHAPVIGTREFVALGLVRVRLPLMPEERAKPALPQLPDAFHHSREEAAIRFPFVRAHLPHKAHRRRRQAKAIAL